MDTFRSPGPLQFEGNICENWKKWIQKFHIFLQASGNDTTPKPRQVAIFLNLIGEEGLEKYNTFELSVEDKNDLQKVIDAFETYCIPKTNETVNRHLFFTYTQKDEESFDNYFTHLKNLSSTCGFGELRDSLIRDRIICGIANKSLKDRLLREENLTLEKSIHICKAAELADAQLKTLSSTKNVNVVNKSKNNAFNATERNINVKRNPPKQKETCQKTDLSQVRLCRKCGTTHKKNSCPAFRKICTHCKKPNHFARMCLTKHSVDTVLEKHETNKVENPESSAQFLGTIGTSSCLEKEWSVELKLLNNKTCIFKLDTGAQCNVLPLNIFNKLQLNKNLIEISAVKLNNYNGSNIEVVGKIVLSCETDWGLKENIEFQVVNCQRGAPAVLGLSTIRHLNLLQKINSVTSDRNTKLVPNFTDQYDDLFHGFGEIKGYVYNIRLKTGSVGKIEPCRKVPVAIMEPLKQELNKMEEMGVISKIEEPTEWVNSMVIVKKPDNSLRICLDPQYLNQNIMREHFQLPSLQEIVSKMPDAKIFSIIDAQKAFWQIRLTEESNKYTTFNTPYGRYYYNRLPYGLCSSPEVFQKCFSQIFGGIDGVVVYIDDILIWGQNQEEHDERLKQVFEVARDHNVKFNKEKCQIGLTEVKYLGHRFSSAGLQPDEDKVKAILEIPTPKNTKELQTFLGMVTYVSKFIPNLSQQTSPLRELLKKDFVWNWTEEQESAFYALKNCLITRPVLQYFDPKKPLVLSVDASQDGIGAVILQNSLPVAYASKSLTETQKSYAQIEKETLAILFGCERFHQYLFGLKNVVVETDHKPLESIFKKPLLNAPIRLQRMRIRLQAYDITVRYRPGKELLLADALSRASIKNDNTAILEQDIEIYIDSIVESLPMSAGKFKKFQVETEQDEELQSVLFLIRDGWPTNQNVVPDIVKPFYNFRDELTECKGLIFKNTALVVPKSLRSDMISRLHYNHMGIEKTKQKARELLYWPHMSKEIEDVVKNCTVCLEFQRNNAREPLLQKDVPDGPWQVLSTDIFYLNRKKYLLIIDHFSKYVELAILEDETTDHIITRIKSCFARHGIPIILYSDNIQQFVCQKFRDFAEEWNFSVITCSPRYPQSNGAVERAIQTVKRMLKKCILDNKDPYIALLEYRNTPMDNVTQSPSEILLGRKVQGLFPLFSSLHLKEEEKAIKQRLKEKQKMQKMYYDRGTKGLQPLQVGNKVLVQDPATRYRRKLIPAEVISTCHRPRSYKLLLLDTGRVIERNRKYIYRSVNS